MTSGAHAVLRAAASFYAPLIALFAFVLLAVRAPGEGVGLLAGLALALVFALHVIVAGADGARAALSPALGRVLMMAGLVCAAGGAAAPGFAYAPHLVEAGLFVIVAAGAALVVTALAGRAQVLRDEDW